ncbi:LysR family transcriptional regulator [Pseudomonas sp. LS44]|uniref:LysR family transcriptional regulator n=1 Tax=Pseudomonas sp. LS44 TaxID=1357074 RepID=UPI00215B45F3|nr:LysR family transcriptional regulator [Pseudomonas sp. LS44]UVE18146.1 LysR family transcriptional regulator [Pseudomonas sp. LS44]
MNLHHLKVFLAVAETGSISAGGQRLFISQPAVTREIRELERQIGLPLFDRQPRGVTLTEAGRRLRHYAERIFSLEQAAEQELRSFAALEDGELNLSASATLGSYVLPPLLRRFRQHWPQIAIHLEVSNTAAVTASLDAARCALGFVEGRFDTERYEHRLLALDALLPVVGVQHPLAGRPRLVAADLGGFPLYLREPGSGTRASVERTFEQLGLALDARLSVGNTEALKQLLDDQQGIAWLSGQAIGRELTEGRLAVLDVQELRVERELHAVWRSGSSLSPSANALLELANDPGNIKMF